MSCANGRRTLTWPLMSCDARSQSLSGRKTSSSVPADSRSLRASRVNGVCEASPSLSATGGRSPGVCLTLVLGLREGARAPKPVGG